MSAHSIPVRSPMSNQIRSLNVLRDLPAIADLVELCFHSTMDQEGQQYIRQMRRASREDHFLQWIQAGIETTSMPMTGYVWDDGDRIIGNISIVPFHGKGKRIYLLANVAVHPEYRCRGIARALTQQAMNYARERHAQSIWLQVRDDNPIALKLYYSMGFQEQTSRTTWQTTSDSPIQDNDGGVTISPRFSRFWLTQHTWLRQLYPDEITWYHTPDWETFGTGIKYWFYRLFIGYDVHQWAAQRNGNLQGVVSWFFTTREYDPLWLAVAPEVENSTVTALLLHARKHLTKGRSLSLDFPAGKNCDAIASAGFNPRRTLVWMHVDGETKS